MNASRPDPTPPSGREPGWRHPLAQVGLILLIDVALVLLAAALGRQWSAVGLSNGFCISAALLALIGISPLFLDIVNWFSLPQRIARHGFQHVREERAQKQEQTRFFIVPFIVAALFACLAAFILLLL